MNVFKGCSDGLSGFLEQSAGILNRKAEEISIVKKHKTDLSAKKDNEKSSNPNMAGKIKHGIVLSLLVLTPCLDVYLFFFIGQYYLQNFIYVVAGIFALSSIVVILETLCGIFIQKIKEEIEEKLKDRDMRKMSVNKEKLIAAWIFAVIVCAGIPASSYAFAVSKIDGIAFWFLMRALLSFFAHLLILFLYKQIEEAIDFFTSAFQLKKLKKKEDNFDRQINDLKQEFDPIIHELLFSTGVSKEVFQTFYFFQDEADGLFP